MEEERNVRGSRKRGWKDGRITEEKIDIAYAEICTWRKKSTWEDGGRRENRRF